MTEGELSRRKFLVRLGHVTVGFALLPLAGCERHSVSPLQSGGEVPFITPVGLMYVKNGAEVSVNGWQMPNIDPGRWTLRIDGLVDRVLFVRYSDLDAEAASAVEVLKTMRCVVDDNGPAGLIGTAVWRGVPLRTFLDRAGIDTSRTKRLRLYGRDGFTNNLSIERIYGDPADGELVPPLLVTHMNGVPLPAEHGKPVRLLVHDSFGYMNVKWLSRIEATDDDSPFGTYQEVGFSDDPQIRLVSRITQPLARVQVPPGRILIAGFALSGAAGIERVEVAIDDGPWSAASLVPLDRLKSENPILASAVQTADAARFPYPYRAVWTPWELTWRATRGEHQITVRAIDRLGNTQPELDNDTTDGINAIPSIPIEVG